MKHYQGETIINKEQRPAHRTPLYKGDRVLHQQLLDAWEPIKTIPGVAEMIVERMFTSRKKLTTIIRGATQNPEIRKQFIDCCNAIAAENPPAND